MPKWIVGVIRDGGFHEVGGRACRYLSHDKEVIEIVPFTAHVDGKLFDDEDDNSTENGAPAIKPGPGVVGVHVQLLIEPPSALFK
jgi:hypothetical protein